MLTETNDILLMQGIFDHGDHIEFLLDLWSELQRSFADATRAPDLDFFSFVQNAFYFAVIYHKKRSSRDSEQGNRSGSNGELPTNSGVISVVTPCYDRVVERLPTHIFTSSA
jgi:hypothetical protein